ncbi:hypothetical protein LT330_005313 [Penicillium expansum]|nr:hypothetical protein LT330_005313 [Penicillium expansum]
MNPLTDFHPTSFPVLSFNGYQGSPKDQIDLVIDDYHDIAREPARVNALAVAWGLVLATYTNSTDVLFGLVRPCSSGVQPYALRLQPEDSVMAALSQGEDIINASDETVESAIKFNNIFVICKAGEESSEAKSNTCPLQINCRIQPDAIQIRAIFDGELLALELLRTILFQLRHVYTRIIYNPHISVADVQGSSPESIEKILQWNAETTPQRVEKLAHHLIEQQCREQPSAPAISAWDGKLTFSELDEHASKMAARLVASGVGPDQFVGLLMEKSMWTTVAIFAVLKAGGCFYLLDASQPAKRLALMCRKAQPRLVLVSAKHEALAEQLDVPIWVVPRDSETGEISAAESQQLAAVQPHNIMYAGFTSGSTGEPKGFAMDHTAFASGLTNYCQQLSLSPQSRVLQYASYAFIVSLTDQLAPLTQGACICVPSEQQLQDDLLGAIRHHDANWLKLTPSVLRLLEPGEISGLKTLVMVGEPMAATELAKWQHSGVNLLSLYGMSENSKGCSYGSRNESGCDIHQFSRPLCATPWVVSPHDPDILMPIGAEGELLLEGPCLSRGYMDNPEQNRMTFLHDPAWLKQLRPESNSRFLRTGDLAKYNPHDGTLHLLGRKGTGLVKIRGQRIELAEIEHHLCPQFNTQEPAVVDVVIPSDDTAQNALLVAFVPIGKQQSTLHRDGLVEGLFALPTQDFRQKARNALSNLHQALPSFMVPPAIVATVALPQTATGKLNRRVLREEASKLSRKDLLAYISHDSAHQDPTTPQEIIIQTVCSQVLNLPLATIGMQSNFFDLGGNSITARELVTKCRQSGLHITVADVFRASSLLSLAQCHQVVDTSVPTEAYDPFKAVRDDFLANLPASLAVDQIEDAFPTLEEQHTMASTHMLDYHLYELNGPVDASQLHRACQAVVDKHTILRSIFIPFREDILQVILRHVDVPFTVHPSGHQSAQIWAKSFCEAELKKTYLANEPRVEFKLVQDAPNHSILIIRLLHAQYDAIGLQKLVSDLWAEYDNQEVRIESDFAAYARECFRQRTSQAYEFWGNLLQDSQVTPVPLPTVAVDGEESVGFEREMPLPTPPAGITMATVIKVAWATVLQEWTGSSDVVFGQLITTRSLLLPSVEEVLGPCTNTIPVRVQRTLKSETPHDLLRAVQSQHAESIGFETIGWNDVVDNCTKWSTGSKPGSVVLFQNYNKSVRTQFGQLSCQKSTQFFNLPPEDVVWLLVFPTSTTALFVIESSNSILRKDEVDPLLDRFCEVLLELCSKQKE